MTRVLFEGSCNMDGFQFSGQVTLRFSVVDKDTGLEEIDRMLLVEVEHADVLTHCSVGVRLSTIRIHAHAEDAYTPRIFTTSYAPVELDLREDLLFLNGVDATKLVYLYKSNFRDLLCKGLEAVATEYPFLLMHFEEDAEESLAQFYPDPDEAERMLQDVRDKVRFKQQQLDTSSRYATQKVASWHQQAWTSCGNLDKMTPGALLRYYDVLKAGC